MATDIFSDRLQLFVEANQLFGGSGSNASTLLDLSGNDRNMIAASAPPVIESGAVGGKKAILFDGTKNPLQNSDTFQITSGFIVANITNFNNYNGLLSTLAGYGILVGNHNVTNKWVDFSYDYFEYRLNDRIFPDSAAPAPINEWGIIFFRFWKGITLDGIQLGSDRSFPARLLNGKVAMLALYDRGWCESEIRQMFQSIGASYQLPIANVFPFQGSKTDPFNYTKKVLSDGQAEPILSVKLPARKTGDLNFSFRSTREFKQSRAFWNEYHPAKSFLYRDYNIITPEDTIYRFPENSSFEDRGNNGVTKNYGFSVIESENLSPGAIPAAPGAILGTPVIVTTGDENDEIVTFNSNIVIV